MNYLYHFVPKDMQGSTLYPLNVLKNTHPEIFAREAEKYSMREELMQKVIPHLDCLWNDVLHLTAVPPSIIKSAIREAGGTDRFDYASYAIDPSLLDPKNAVIYLNGKGDFKNKDSADFIPFDPCRIEQYSSLPAETITYYKTKYENSQKPLLFHRVPHILYKGTIDISGLPIVRA